MNCQRQGSNLRTEIRIALSVLKRDPNEINTRRMGIAELKQTLRDLRAEWKKIRAATDATTKGNTKC